MPYATRFIEKMGIDDAVGAVTVHGVLGIWGVMAVGIFASGYPALQGDAGVAVTSFMGQFVCMICMALVGFVPGYLISLIMKMMSVLRVDEKAEIADLDPTKVPVAAYPEGIPASAEPTE